LAAINGPQLVVVGGVVEEPIVEPDAAFAAQTPVHGAPAPELGIGVIPAELMVVLTKFGPLLVVPELNRFNTLAFGALRFSSKSPSNDSVALKFTAIPVTVAPVGIPLTTNPVLTPGAVFPIAKVIAPDAVVELAGVVPPDATKFNAGPDGQILPTDGVTKTVVGVLATTNDVVAKLEHVPSL
jgi:hypothetical protein